MTLRELEQEYNSNLGKYIYSHTYDDFDDIFLFGLHFYAALCDSLKKTEELEFTVKGEECKELFMSFYSPLAGARSPEHTKISFECKFLTLLKCRELSKIEVIRLYLLYIVLCHSFYGNKEVMLNNLKYIFELGHRFCSVYVLGELEEYYKMGIAALEQWD
ncbi:MAG: hypothetical protein HDT43_04185 [Ruminococcaceae bacterium]|nr:hypothetical protein [Oscillospiraceae bacterium]